jgi:hypothetical protein
VKAVLELEVIGDDMFIFQAFRRRGQTVRHLSLKQEIDLIKYGDHHLKPWVARITGLDEKFGFKREFLRYDQKDYSRANSVGSRGVYQYYVLSDGLYEVNRRTGWRSLHRYFMRVDGERMTELGREEVIACLKNASNVAS